LTGRVARCERGPGVNVRRCLWSRLYRAFTVTDASLNQFLKSLLLLSRVH